MCFFWNVNVMVAHLSKISVAFVFFLQTYIVVVIVRTKISRIITLQSKNHVEKFNKYLCLKI